MGDIAVPFFTSTPATPPPWPGIVVVMEGNGISPQLLRVCERLAARGLRDRRARPLLALRRQRPDKTDGALRRTCSTPTAAPTSSVRRLAARDRRDEGRHHRLLHGRRLHVPRRDVGRRRRRRPVLRRRHRAAPRRPRSARCSRSSAATTNGSRATEIAKVEAAPPRRRRRLRRRRARLHARRLRQLPRDRRARRVDSACSRSSRNTYRSTDGDTAHSARPASRCRCSASAP